MKTKIKRHSRSVLSVILAVCMLVTCFTVGLVATDAAKTESESVGAAPSTIYFAPNSNWLSADQVFQLNIWKSGQSSQIWGTEVETGIYEFTGVDTSYTNCQFVRFKADKSKEWNRTGTLTTSSDKNLYTQESDDVWSGTTGGTWSTYTPTASSFTVNFGVNGSNGTLSASGSTTGALTTGGTVDSGETVTFTANPSNGYGTKWYSNPSCTTEISNTGNSYSTTASSNLNVYVKFIQQITITVIDKNSWGTDIQAYTYNGNDVGSNGGWGSGTSTPAAVTGYTDRYTMTLFQDTNDTTVIFNKNGGNGTNQTNGVTLTNGYYYLISVDTNNGNRVVTVSSSDPELTSYTYYIDGRFAVYNASRTTQTVTAGSSDSISWSTDSKNIPFTETSTAGLYKVDTYKTIKELSTYASNKELYFFVGRSTNNATIDAWYNPASGQNLTQSNSDTQYSVALANNNSNSFLFTDSSNTNTNYVTIYFDANTGKLYFHVDAMASYTVTLKLGDTTHSKWNDNTTADKTLTVSGATTLPTVTPGTGYQFQNWSVTDNGGGTATLANETVNGSATVTVDNNSVVLTANVAPVSETVVYVAKNDNISKIYAWKTSSEAAITSAFPGNSFDNSNQVYNIGGIEYYKFTVNTGTDNFSFVVNDGTNNGSESRQSKDATNYTAGHTYYVQWYGTGYKTDSVTNIGVDWYPKYAVAYKPSSAEDISANWTRVDFSSNSAALNNLTAQNYVFYIVRQDKINGTYTDNQWYNTCETLTRSSRLNKEATHSASGNITLKADAPGNYSINIDRLDGDTRINIGADYPVGYRAVGNATFFGTAWDTTSSNYAYMFTQLATPYTDTTDGNKVYTYSCSKTMDYSVGTFEFKAWDTNDTWYPAGAGNDIQVTNGVKRGQTITFYLNPATGDVTYKITGEPSGESWPPSDIQGMMGAAENPLVEQNKATYPKQYDTLIYKIATGSSAITSSPVTLTPLYQKTNPGTEGAWWADFTSVLPSIGTDQLYFNITSNGSYTGFYSNIANDGSSFDLTDAPGITVKRTDKDSSKYFVEVSGVESRVTNLGVYITKDASNNFTYKFYTIKGSASASKVVKVYAKDGAIRRNGTARDPKSNMDYSTFEKYANTFLTDDTYNTRMTGAKRASTHGATGTDEWTDSTNFNRYTYDYVTGVEKGSTIYFKTVLKNDDYMNQYYLVGYSINGTVYQLHTVAESQTGTVTETFTIPTDWDYDYVEITPIYFLRSGTSIRFYVEGYDQNVMDAGWGNTVGVYPYYQDPTNNDQVANVNNPFGGYPGQPLVFYKGNYYADIPKSYKAYTENSSSTVTCEIKGITLSNMYWDDVHLYTGEVSLHYQTYDFDDLYKIYKEYGNDVDNIICAFKYENRKNNDEPASFTNATSPATYTNGWELLKNYKGEAIDIFGSVLTDQAAALALQPTAAAVHVISQDYKSNCAGQYATEYAVYNTDGTKVVESGGKTTIVPSALAIKTAANFDNYDPQTKAFKGIYNALKADSKVVGKPVFVTYEKSIYGGGDKADRCDARWYFSKKNDPANAKTRIEYSDNLGETWTTDTFTSNTATGSHSGSTAYFTGLSTEADNIPETAAGNTTTTDTSANANLGPCIGGGYYVFNATAGTGYKFVGWYILRDNYQLNAGASSYASGTTNFTSHAEIAKNGDIFVARFVKVTSGEFTINHRVHKDSTGFGDVYVQAVVKNSSGNTLATYGATSGASATNTVTIPSSTGHIANNSGNTIEATFVPEPYGTSSFVNFYATVSDLLQGYNEVDYIKSIVINMPGVEGYDSLQGIYAKVTYDVNRMFSASGDSPTQIVSSVTHYSKFALRTDLSYLLRYKFTTRYYDDKYYTYSANYTEAELRSYFYDQITNKTRNTITLDKQFVQSKAPFESNYREDLTWVVDDVTFGNNYTEGYLTAHQEKLKWSNAAVYDFTNAGVMQTKRMAAPYMLLFHTDTETKPSFGSTAAETTAINNWSQNDGKLYAPLRTIYEESGETKPLYIVRWDIYQLDSFTYKTTGTDNTPKMQDDGINLDVDTSKSKLVAQSYSSVFNYVGFEDYAVVPVYSKENVNRQGISDGLTNSSATLLTVTRNHWNANVDGNTKGGTYKDSADRIYVDFMLNYKYQKTVDGSTQNYLLSSTDESIKVGFVIKSYTMVNGKKVYRTKNDQVISQTVLVDKSNIDNKNRLEYCYGFNNTQNNSQWGLMFEFTPFIVDTGNQQGSTGAEVKIGNNTYKALKPIADADVLDGVNFYMIGKSDTYWG